MKSALFQLLGISLVSTALSSDWPLWRGPARDGKAASDAEPPLTWSDTGNILWKVPIPGQGHATPVIVGDRIFIATADAGEETQSVVCFDRASGKELWNTVVNRGKLYPKIHRKNTHASPTPAWDGEQLVAVFPNNGGVQVAAVSPDGDIAWSKRAGDFRSKLQFGYGASPTIHKDTVIVPSDFKDGGFLAAFRTSNGDEAWRIERPGDLSYSSPVVATVAGREQLLIAGQSRIDAYHPDNGKKLWSVDGGSPAVSGTVVWGDGTVFSSGGYPNKKTLAVLADGSGTILWENEEKCYEQSMLYHDGHLYAVTDQGKAFCWRGSDGVEMWSERVGRGGISASPVLAAGRIYATFEDGTTTVFRASPERFEKLAVNRLGNSSFASQVMLGDRIFARIANSQGGKRSEFLVCISEK